MTEYKIPMKDTATERVARALIDQIGSPWPYDEMDPMVKTLWHGHADAAIEAHKAHQAEAYKAHIEDKETGT